MKITQLIAAATMLEASNVLAEQIACDEF